MHIHIALYKWKSTAKKAEIDEALALIENLAQKVPGIVEIVCRKNESKYSEGYSHVIMVRGQNQAAIDAYRAHPDHKQAAKIIDTAENHGIGVDFSTD